METKLPPHIVNKAVDLYATIPNVHHKDVADELGVSYKTLLKLRKDADFWKKVWDTYLVTYETDVLDVCRSMVREALAGNVQAGRLVLEHSGKLQKNINITISSPFENWLENEQRKQLKPSKDLARSNGSNLNANWIKDAEIIEPPEDVKDNIDVMDKELIKRRKWLNRRRELHNWNKRAKAVNIDLLPARRPTPGQRQEWEESIAKAEGL